MNTVDHNLYSLDHTAGAGHQTLQFATIDTPGTTEKEVLQVLLDRVDVRKDLGPAEKTWVESNLRMAGGIMECGRLPAPPPPRKVEAKEPEPSIDSDPEDKLGASSQPAAS